MALEKDELWAAWLHKALGAYRLPRGMRGRSGSFGLLPERLTLVFRDLEEPASASDLGRPINAALHESETLVVPAAKSGMGWQKAAVHGNPDFAARHPGYA